MWKKDFKKTILITAGDPAGIGSEIIVKTLNNFKTSYKIIVIGEKNAFYPFTDNINEIKSLNGYKDGYLNIINMGYLKKPVFGKPSNLSAMSAIKSLETAISLAKSFSIPAIVTAPIYKKGIIELADYKYFTGHTEFLAESFKSKVLMMFYGSKLKVATLTTHIPLKSVPINLNSEKIITAVKIADDSLKKFFGIKSPKIALLGLNPHSGEEGKIGTEEIDILKPAIKKIKSMGIDIDGPLPADTALYEAYKGEYDFVLGLYHDQVLPAFKTLYFNTGVNVTLGLPIIRTSPDHGTAFDIAGKGIADETSFKNALKLAIKLVNRQ